MGETVTGFVPIMLMQVIYGFFVAGIAKRTGKNVALYWVLTLIPLFGSVFFAYVIWTSYLRLLDDVKRLKAKQ